MLTRDPQAILAKLVRQARLNSGLSQADFARTLQKTQTVISRYEAGSVEPPGMVVIHCMHMLGLQVDPSRPRYGPCLDEVDKALEALREAIRSLNGAEPNSQILKS
ncbi:helix-turn-helix transcriptional regulator [Xanthomonas sp. WHRI 8391]|uniref:helix-turn-helix domain-containing protein n=1 Tax=Xanthomonas sp. WHRI 8391 TaxID=3161573 RepID=UPI001A1E7104|nr:helix-turn-helix transcriptional regulator [Xanthomonas hortorum pv. carotae]